MATTDPFAAPLATKPTDFAAQAKAVGDGAQASASTGVFDESKGVAGRVQQLTSAGGPLMTAARTRAKQQAAKLGLSNTSMAAQAGEQAVIETATPIAGADANLYQGQQLANQSAQNQVSLANANIRAQTGVAGMQLGENARQFDTGLSWDKDKFGSNLLEQRRQFDASYGLQGRQLDQNQQQFESTLGLEGRKLDQSNSQFQQSIGLEGQKLAQNQSQFTANLSQQDRQFLSNLDLQQQQLTAQREQFAQRFGLDTAQLQINRDQLSQQDQQFLADLDLKGKQLAEQKSQFEASFGLEGKKLDQQGQQFGANLLEQKRQFDTTAGFEGQKLSQQDQQFKDNLGLQKDNLAAQREQFAQKLGMDQQQLDLNRDQLGQQDRQFLAELDQKSAQLAQQESQFSRDQQNKVTLANLDASNREKLIQIEAGYKSEIAGNENISRAWGTMMDEVNQIQNNPELDYSTKSTLIDNTQKSFKSFAEFWKKATGGSADVSDLLQFGQAAVPAPATPPPGPGYDQSGDPSRDSREWGNWGG